MHEPGYPTLASATQEPSSGHEYAWLIFEGSVDACVNCDSDMLQSTPFDTHEVFSVLAVEYIVSIVAITARLPCTVTGTFPTPT